MSTQLSEKQLQANRANANRSTGPRTQEGKARSAQNSRKHSFTADQFAVFRAEDAEAVAKLKADLVSVYQPANAQELFALERIAITQNILLRVARLEAGLVFRGINQAADEDGQFLNCPNPVLCQTIDMTLAQNFNHAIADGFVRSVNESDAWKLFLRYQSQAERNYRRALEDFDRLKALRAELPNEPISETEAESAQPLPALPDEPIRASKPPIPPPPAPPIHTDAPFTEPIVICRPDRPPSPPPQPFADPIVIETPYPDAPSRRPATGPSKSRRPPSRR